jgi:MFS family permease
MGLEPDIGIDSKKYFNVLMIFFVGYLVFMIPANLNLRWVGAPTQIGIATLLFGVASISQSAIHTYAQALGIRVIIGAGEAFVQVGILYFSYWYRRNEVATRLAVYYTSATLSGCFSGLIAYSVDKNLDGVAGRASWRWLFIIEGTPALAIGILIFFALPNFPEIEKAKGSWLFTEEELDLAVRRTIASNNTPHERVQFSQVLASFRDPKIYFTGMIYGTLCLGLASVSSFLPTFISEFGFSRLQTQLFTMIPYAFATVTLLSMCIISDRLNSKGPVLIICLSTTMIGYILLMTNTNKVALIAGTCFVTSGLYPGIMICASWITINHGGYSKRATAFAFAQIVGQCLSIIGTQVYRKPPRFLAGHGTLLAFYCAAFAATFINYFYMKRQNKKKEAVAAEWAARGLPNPDSAKSYEELYDYHPDFRYIL